MTMLGAVTRGSAGYLALPSHDTSPKLLEQPQPHRLTPHIIVKMANRGYDVVVDIDQEVRPLQYFPQRMQLTSFRAT